MQINRTTFVLALVLLGLLPSMAHAQSWYNTSWLYRKSITIDHTKVGTGPHTNYPVLISRADTDLQARAQTDADDILFTSADGTTKLDHEVESYTSGSGTLVAWVEIPSLSSAVDTVIYMYYGNAAAASQQNVTGTWNANFVGVYHLNNAVASATNTNNGTDTHSANVAGKIANGRGFNPTDGDGADFITITGLMGSPTSYTLGAWANLITIDPNAAEIISLGDHSVLRYDVSNGKVNGVGQVGAATWVTTTSSTNYATGWHYVVYTFNDAGNSQQVYVDGQPDGAATTQAASPYYIGGGTNTFIGKHGNANVNMDFYGTLDEARVSNTNRSAGWVLTDYNTQSSPSTFYAVGNEAKTYYSRGTGNWNTAATWSNTGHGGAASATAPGSVIGDYVIIGNSNTVTLDVSVTNQIEVVINSTGTLNMGTNTISGAGPFTLNSGATLGIGSTAGITSSGATGNVQVTGTRTFSTGANYNYNGTLAQVTGNGLPATVNDLTINDSAGVTLSATAAVSSNLTVSAGTFDLGSFTANRASAGGTLTVSNGAALKIGGTNGFPTNYSTNSLGATSTVDYGGTAQTVAAQNYGHLTLSNSGAKTFAAGTIGLAGSFTINGTATANMTTNSPTTDYNGSGSQTVLSQTYYNLTVSNAGTKTLAGSTIVNSNLTVSNTAVLDLSSFTANRASAGGTLSVANGATLKIGGTNTLPSNYSAHSIGATSTVEYSGTSQSLAVLNSAQDYGHLTISGSGTKTLAGSENVGGTLLFTSGTITTGANTLYIKAGGTVSRVSGHVIGNLKKNVATGATSRTFETGDATNYTPVTVDFLLVLVAGDLTASVASGDHANIGTSTINATRSVNRNWTLTNSGITFTTYNATFTFVAGDVDGGANTNAFIVGKYGGSWTYPIVGTKTATTTQATLLTAFSDFQLGEMATSLKTWDGGAGTNNWGDAANWNTDGVPISTDDVDLSGANTININVAAVTNNLILNNAGLTLTVNSGNSLTVSGNLTLTSGTLNTANAFPTVTGTVDVAAGTVGFTGSGAQTIPAYNYNNLTSSSTGGRTLASSGTIGIAGTFTPGTNTYTITGSTIDYKAAGAQTIAALNYNNLTLSNSGTKTFASGTSGVASTLSITGSATANATTNSSVVSYNGSTSQTITALTYYGLNVSSTGGTVTGINTTVTNFSINSGTLDLNTFTLTVTGTATYTAGAINNGTVTSTGATTTFTAATFGAIVNATSDVLSLNGGTFNNTVTLTKNGATNVAGTGGNTFNSTTTIANSGSGYLILGNTVADTFNGNVTFNNTGSNVLYVAFNGPGNQFNGNATFNNTGTVSAIISNFGGGATGTAYNGNIVVNNTSAGGGIYFGGAGGLSTLAATKTITVGATGFTTGTLYFASFTQTGATAQTITLTGTAVLNVGSASTFNGNVNFAAPQLLLNGCTYNGTATLAKTGATDNTSNGGNTFASTATISNSGAGWLALGFISPDIFNGSTTFTNNSANSIYVAHVAAGNQFNGTVTFNNLGSGNIFNYFGGTATVAYNGNIVVNNTSAAGGIYFGAIAGSSATLAATKTISIGGTGFATGTLYLSLLTQLGTTAQALTLTGTALLQIGPSATFNGNVDFVAPQMLLNGSTFNGTASIRKSGATQNNSLGGNVFNGATTIANSGSGHFVLGFPTGIDMFNGDLTLTNTGTAGLYPAYNSAGHQFNGNITVNQTTGTAIYFCGGTGTATLATGKTISVGGSGFSSGTLVLPRFTQTGSTAQTFSLTGTAVMQIGPTTTFNGNVNIAAPQLIVNASVFNGTASLTKNGATDNTSIGGNIFNATATITNSGAGFLRLANTTLDDFNADATFIQTGSGLLQPAYATNSTFAGNLSTTGTATAIVFGGGAGTVTLNGTSTQSIVGSLLTTFNGFTISNGSGVTLGTNATVNGTLTFTSGAVTTNSNELYLGSAGSVSRTSGHVIGNFKKNIATGATSKTFEIGDASTYTPVTVAFGSVTTAGDLTAKTISGDHASIGSSTIDASKSVNRNWTLTNSGIAFTTYDATFTFVAGDLDAGAATGAFIAGNYSAGWTYPTVGTKTSTTTQGTGLTAFGDFQLGEAAPLPPAIAHVNTVLPTGPQPPGTELTYSATFTNSGGQPAQVLIVVDPIPANTDFKLGSASTVLGTTGLTVTVEFSNDNAATWTYTPVSGGGGALAGYDRLVTHVRWRFTGNLSQIAPNNAGSISITTRIQ